MNSVEQAQKALDKAIDAYRSNPANADGGSPDELQAIAYRIAKRFDLTPPEIQELVL